MGCSICLEAYTDAARPAALPCGHVFHVACVADWLGHRPPGAAPVGCPLCKASASASSVRPLYPSEMDELGGYVARGSAPAGEPLLDAARDMLRAMHTYALGVHGVRASSMRKAATAWASAARRGAVPDSDAAAALEVRHKLTQTLMAALADAMHETEQLSRRLAQQHAELDERRHTLHARDKALHVEQHALAAQRRQLQHDRLAWKQKQKRLLQAKQDLAAKAGELDGRAQAVEARLAEQQAQWQESLAHARSASADAIRRAAVSEEAAAQRVEAAATRARLAEERAADATSSLESIRARNQLLAEQMRQMKEALWELKAQRRRERAELHALRRGKENTQRAAPGAPGTPTKSDGVALSSPRSLRSSSPAPAPPSPSAAAAAAAGGAYDAALDDALFPMPGLAAWRSSAAAPAAPAPAARAPTAPDAWARGGGRLALGPRRKPR